VVVFVIPIQLVMTDDSVFIAFHCW